VCFVEFQLPLWLCMMMGSCSLLLHVHDVLLCVDLVFKKQQWSPYEKMVHDYVRVCS
jgi:hypothetical protein